MSSKPQRGSTPAWGTRDPGFMCSLPLAEALLQLAGVRGGHVPGGAQVGGPVQGLAGGSVAGAPAAAGGALPVLLLRAGVLDHPHGQHRDVLGVRLAAGPWGTAAAGPLVITTAPG